MLVKSTRKDHYMVLSCSGTTVGLPPGPIHDVLRALMDGTREIILDLEHLDYLSTTGVISLADSVKRVREYGGHLGIAAPTPQARRLIKMNGLGHEIPIYYSVLEAVSRLDLIDYQPEAWQDQADMLLIYQKDLPIAGELRKAIKEHPLKHPFRLKPVREVEDATSVLLNEVTGCILVDSALPMFKVINLLDFLRNEPRIGEIPVLAVSEDLRLNEAEMMVRHGAHEILTWPINHMEAFVRIHNMICMYRDHTPYYPPGRVNGQFGNNARFG